MLCPLALINPVVVLFSYIILKFLSDDVGLFVSCEFCFHGKSFRVVSLYVLNRNSARDQFFEQVTSWVDLSVPSILCGHFNTAFDFSLG